MPDPISNEFPLSSPQYTLDASEGRRAVRSADATQQESRSGNRPRAWAGGWDQVHTRDTTASAGYATMDTSTISPATLMAARNQLYTVKRLRDDLTQALKPHMGSVVGNNTGKTTTLSLWSNDEIASLYRGIVSAQQTFFSHVPLERFARLILTHAAQQSGGDPTHNVGDNPKRQQGLMGVTPESILKAYQEHGTAIYSRKGELLLDPSRQADLSDPATSVLLWSWFTHNSVASGASPADAARGQRTHVTQDVGNALSAWSMGPGTDRRTAGANLNAIYNRMSEHFHQSGFGSKADFDKLLAQPVDGDLVHFH